MIRSCRLSVLTTELVQRAGVVLERVDVEEQPALRVEAGEVVGTDLPDAQALLQEIDDFETPVVELATDDGEARARVRRAQRLVAVGAAWNRDVGVPAGFGQVPGARRRQAP